MSAMKPLLLSAILLALGNAAFGQQFAGQNITMIVNFSAGGPTDVEGRVIPYRHRAGGVVWFDFKAICGWGRSQNDYIDLAKRFHTVVISGVPRMGLDRADEARRFTLLVDVFYDQRVKMIVSAAAQPGELLARDVDNRDPQLQALVFQFERTASRLAEMQTREYLEQPRGGRGE